MKKLFSIQMITIFICTLACMPLGAINIYHINDLIDLQHRYDQDINQLNLNNLDIETIDGAVFVQMNELFPELDDLDLSNNHLSTLPAEIGVLQRLQILDLSNNTFTQWPAAIETLFNLRDLSLDNNNISVLPASISALEQLDVLSLENTPLANTPNWLEIRDAINANFLPHTEIFPD